MNGASYIGCRIQGIAHGTRPLTGTIYDNCSNNVFINGNEAAFVVSITQEFDSAHPDPGYGYVSQGSSVVFINGKAAAYKGCAVTPHNGTAYVIEGSNNVLVGA